MQHLSGEFELSNEKIIKLVVITYGDKVGNCITQEEYEEEEEVGKLECGHAYHLHCIKQWLAQKNACPVCKAEASALLD